MLSALWSKAACVWVSVRPYSSVVATCNLKASLTRAGDFGPQKQLARSHKKEPRSFSDMHTSRQSPHPAALVHCAGSRWLLWDGERPPSRVNAPSGRNRCDQQSGVCFYHQSRNVSVRQNWQRTWKNSFETDSALLLKDKWKPAEPLNRLDNIFALEGDFFYAFFFRTQKTLQRQKTLSSTLRSSLSLPPLPLFSFFLPPCQSPSPSLR